MAIHRALKAAGVHLAYSHGFHPHPRLTLGPALPLGTETLADLGEIRVTEVPPLAESQDRMNACLPEGLRLEALWVLPQDCKALTGGGTREDYRLTPSAAANAAAEARDGWASLAEGFWGAGSFTVTKHRKGKTDRVLEAKEFAEALWMDGETVVLRLRRHHDGTALGPEDLLRTLAGLPEGIRATDRIVKTRAEIL
jgi:radical SAM-linked protein